MLKVVAALEKGPAEPTRASLLSTIFHSDFDFGGPRLSYRLDSNRGSSAVFLTMIDADGKVRPIKSLAGASQ